MVSRYEPIDTTTKNKGGRQSQDPGKSICKENSAIALRVVHCLLY